MAVAPAVAMKPMPVVVVIASTPFVKLMVVPALLVRFTATLAPVFNDLLAPLKCSFRQCNSAPGCLNCRCCRDISTQRDQAPGAALDFHNLAGAALGYWAWKSDVRRSARDPHPEPLVLVTALPEETMKFPLTLFSRIPSADCSRR